jgi:hypothetical protein
VGGWVVRRLACLDECEEKVVRTGDRIPVEPTRRRTAAKPASVSICRLTRASLRPVKSGAITIWFPASTPMRKPRTARSTVDVGTFEQHPQPVGRNAITSRKVAVCREKSLAAVSGWRDHGPSRLKERVDDFGNQAGGDRESLTYQRSFSSS